ncbi:MAG: hybrid sensor histidine kinase/response regulator [Bacteroidetes bacterium 13_1_20CM_4_60_6]|jgi:PAS domain S-box-containing protein|uniref:PAS domain-containing hybrid sensor histidine kinase/response regulator n=1 Tax=Comamonadaceae TaxID=80864 RepID=UPI0002F95932|nr:MULTISPECIES: PAS domain-containing sensor histidine kinase [Comamonadaceae]OLE70247.1 MAG: hybrid sensor histidine kinase/response regulator [Bacteroidetes bacterium 13_1_20CM_4_60_6]OLE94767.1 MAG: hybrid sensor histidine kinase/response regulator [Delftia sp. 13_1_40CM_3_66_6]MDC2862863.1 PAS domain S-box protein [Delftia sp. DT-2]MDH0852085.1 PAS domain S-box protein [Delftia tsuruhatensis]PQA79685.1 PAS domain-containing sensor histidine kinase [Limnohabitans sp. TS-CS-82]
MPPKNQSDALRQAAALQAAIFNSAMFSKIATDANGVIQIFNVGAERMLGYTAAEVIDRITPADISDPAELIARAKALSIELSTPIAPGFDALVFKAAHGIEDIYELTCIRKNGSRFPVVVSVTALRDADEAIIGYLLIATDNSARKQAEAAKREHDALLQTIHLHSIVSVTDRSGRIVEVNDGFCLISGYSRAELLGQTHRIVNSGVQSETFWIDMWRSITAGERWRGEICNRAKDGSLYWVDSVIAPFLDEAGQTQKYISIRTDVTARMEAAQARLLMNADLAHAKQVAEKANLAKSEFLSSMSHELRSPLNAILGFAQLLDSGSPAPTPPQKESIDQVLVAGWYLLALINEILDLSLIESGKLSLSPESMALADVLTDCQAMIEPQARKSGIAVMFPGLACPHFVKADRTRVKQVLVNLLSNAIKYNRPGGSVKIACHDAGTGRVRVTFEDTGPGLPPEKLAQLFQPFNRLGQESGTEEGTGIGLVVSKRLIELMGGAIGAMSTVGVGSTFWIELDAAAAPELGSDFARLEPLPRARGDANAPRQTLLCVEDNPANLLLIEKLIARRPDIRLLSARDAERGIQIARSRQPDVILMDINLPGMSGLEALRALAGDARTSCMPVIALSANAMARDIEKGLEAGFFRYLTKPIKVDKFMETLDSAMTAARSRAAATAIPGDTSC